MGYIFAIIIVISAVAVVVSLVSGIIGFVIHNLAAILCVVLCVLACWRIWTSSIRTALVRGILCIASICVVCFSVDYFLGETPRSSDQSGGSSGKRTYINTVPTVDYGLDISGLFEEDYENRNPCNMCKNGICKDCGGKRWIEETKYTIDLGGGTDTSYQSKRKCALCDGTGRCYKCGGDGMASY